MAQRLATSAFLLVALWAQNVCTLDVDTATALTDIYTVGSMA